MQYSLYLLHNCISLYILFQITFGLGVYSGLYVAQNYEVSFITFY